MVDGQLQVLTRRVFIAAQLAHHPTAGIDLDALGSGLAAKLVFELGLDPDLADLEFGDLQQRVGVLKLRQVAFGHRPDIADDMREVGAERVNPA